MTIKWHLLSIFALVLASNGMNSLHIIAFTHRNLSVNDIGCLHIEPENQAARLRELKQNLELGELMFLSTCNRIEFTFTSSKNLNADYVKVFLDALYPELDTMLFVENADTYSGSKAVEHILRVASSVDSMVVGEREIITQVRNAYDTSNALGLTGDLLRILMRHTIETAKKVYTETSIAKRPVSVVSLAYHRLKDMNVPLDARVLIVGAGTTNTNMSRFLRKHGFTNFHVFNRTLEKAESLASDINGVAYPLPSLEEFDKGFDIIITCTAAERHVLTPEIYEQLLQGETDRKVVIDIAIPQDLSPEVVAKHNVHHISVEALQKISTENLKARSKEVKHVEAILDDAIVEFKHLHKERSVELAMREVPRQVKAIKQTALNEVFKNDFNNLDETSQEVVEKIIGYMEKKYMSMPMLMAKEILLKKRP